jgi:7,8-dihydro-6-hydroxymethylpterin dimethyltransferase
MRLELTSETLLKRTTSRCPVCREPAPAEVIRVTQGKDAKVYLKKTCTEHGTSTVCIASDARFYWLAQGDPQNACCGGTACCASDEGKPGTLGRNASGRGDGPFETLSTCLALIEIVNSCNLACPTCFADSPVGATGPKLDAIPLADVQRRIEGVIARKGPIEILQLSGGEPTLHPEFFELLAWTQAHPHIGYVLLNTNGVKIATDAEFAKRLGETFVEKRFQLYLQFDGPQEAGQRELRGADLRAMRDKTIRRCEEMGLPVTLAMTVNPQNLPHVWEAIEYGLQFTNVRGVAFQPMFLSGRTGVPQQVQPGAVMKAPAYRLNTADIILAAVGQSNEKLRFEDFTPLPCGDPNCATIGYLLKTPLGIRSVSDFIDFSAMQGFLHDKMNYSLGDLSQCGCENEPLAEMLHAFELKESDTFRLLIKPFMDAWTWDQDRIDRCCTHVIRPDGQLDSFCRYYSGFETR